MIVQEFRQKQLKFSKDITVIAVGGVEVRIEGVFEDLDPVPEDVGVDDVEVRDRVNGEVEEVDVLGHGDSEQLEVDYDLQSVEEAPEQRHRYAQSHGQNEVQGHCS